MGTEAQQLLGGVRGQLRDRSVALEPARPRPPRGLSSVERSLLENFGAPLQGRVLVLGCSAGRFTAQLHRMARELHGVCETAQDLGRCRRAYRHGVFTTCDVRDVLDFAPRAFDAVLVPGDGLDVLDEHERRAALQDVRALLAAEGVLMFCSHNRDCVAQRPGWLRVLVGSPRHPLQSARCLPLRLRNRHRLSALERAGDGYELRNDAAREFGALHYYIGRDAQERQLSELGYELLECLNRDGGGVQRSATPQLDRLLHYVARAH